MVELQRASRKGLQFQNPVPTDMGSFRFMLKAITRKILNKAQTVPKQQLGPFSTDASVYSRTAQSGLRVTWFGHSSTLLEIDGTRVLIDPVWDERASPAQWFGPKRFFPPTLPVADLPAVDAILISHDHYDHLGAGTVRKLSIQRPSVRWIAPLAVGKVLRGFGVAAECITELDWTENTEVGAGLRITALPARHFSGRSLRNRFHTLWASFVLAGPEHRVYYGADSGWWEGFSAIGREYGPFDLTMLEIGAYDPMWANIHLGPDAALRAFKDLGGGTFMPIHWGLFDLALHDWWQPIQRLTQVSDEQGTQLFSPVPGEPTEVTPREAVRSEWWRAGGVPK